MPQLRNKTGTEFESKICKEKGWNITKKSNPKIFWSGVGRGNLDKILSTNLDPSKFFPIIEKSSFDKYDAIDGIGNRYEIKKYYIKDCYNWKLLSEPFFKICDRRSLKKVVSIFGASDVEEAAIRYNKFLDSVSLLVGDDIKNRITSSFMGIQFIDGFVPTGDIEYKWSIEKGWMGFNRLSLMFKINKQID